MAHGINANQLHKWRREFLSPQLAVAEPQMHAVTITPEHEPVHAMAATEGTLDIHFPKARLSLRGRVDLDVLQTVLAALRQR